MHIEALDQQEPQQKFYPAWQQDYIYYIVELSQQVTDYHLLDN